MMEEFPGNSRRPITPTDKTVPCVEEKKLDKVVTGVVVRRKKSLGRRLKETFFSENGGVFRSLLKEVLVPALQDVATDIVKQGIDRVVYPNGEVRSPGRTVRGSSLPRTHISYDRPGAIRPAQASPARRPAFQRSSVDIGDIILATKIEAQVVGESLYDTVQEYGTVSVANLKELIGEPSVSTDNRWGWTDLETLEIKRVREGYLLVLPEPEDLR